MNSQAARHPSRPSKIRWGILGTGNIAQQFARGLRDAANAELGAVGSRSLEKSQAFGREFSVTRCHGSYAQLADDPQIDVIYISTPHALHRDNAILCLERGKPVLCEKPLAINRSQAAEMIELARRKNLFLMEAMWTRFLPPIVRLRKLLAEGVIGDVRLVSADFGIHVHRNPQHRLFDPCLGGGCLLDVGIYPINLANMILGNPSKMAGEATLGPTNVDEQAAITLVYPGGQIATLLAAIQTQTAHHAGVFGTKGFIHIGTHWWKGAPMLITTGDKTWRVDEPILGEGYQYEADEVARCLAAGEIQSDIMPWDQTLSVLSTMDQLRAMWGVKYPME
jgi:predicted dehydrogenase